MRINEHTCVFTTKVVLVPYSAHHVPKYHGWMKDPEIQEATASEPLTLEEEYAMQRSWRDDADKLTFIICRPLHHGDVDRRDQEPRAPRATRTVEGERTERLDPHREIEAMIGDVNLFISKTEDDDGHREIFIGEVELMIAEAAQQRKGYGRAALLAFLKYILHHEPEILAEFRQARGGGHEHRGGPASSAAPGVRVEGAQHHHQFDHLAVKIGSTNFRSTALFESLAFRKTSEDPSYFGEFELRLSRAGLDDLIAHAEADVTATRKGLLEGYRETGYSCL